MKNVINNIKRVATAVANAVANNINDERLSASDLAYMQALMKTNSMIY